jgi:hypothetical protein
MDDARAPGPGRQRVLPHRSGLMLSSSDDTPVELADCSEGAR